MRIKMPMYVIRNACKHIVNLGKHLTTVNKEMKLLNILFFFYQFSASIFYPDAILMTCISLRSKYTKLI